MPSYCNVHDNASFLQKLIISQCHALMYKILKLQQNVCAVVFCKFFDTYSMPHQPLYYIGLPAQYSLCQ